MSWQPIETATDDVVIAWDRGVRLARATEEGWVDEDEGPINPTYWMPLPKPPE